MALEPGQPIPFVNAQGRTAVRCDTDEVRAVSRPIGDEAMVLVWIAELCNVAGLEFDDAELPDRVVIQIPPGS